jgi:glycosyltransferase involved in cell wall biosynthesis
MKIAYWVPDKYVTSVKIYTDHVIAQLKGAGIGFIPFRSGDDLPGDVDLYWDSTCTGGKHPNRRLIHARKPVVVTLHGAAPMSMPLSYTYNGKSKQFRGWFQNQKKRVGWQSIGQKVDHIITVSEYARDEIRAHLPLGNKEIHVIYHGFDQERFSPLAESEWLAGRPYFFHISVYQPKKNVERIVEAYLGMAEDKRQPMLIISPGNAATVDEGGLQLVNKFIAQEELAEHMRRAQGFIFPSLHESFGLPILEAMASGCPVLTSNSTSCDEIAGDAAIKVDPYNTDAVRQGMERLFNDAPLRMELRRKGLARAKEFSWAICAEQHAAVFEQAASKLKAAT